MADVSITQLLMQMFVQKFNFDFFTTVGALPLVVTCSQLLMLLNTGLAKDDPTMGAFTRLARNVPAY